MQIANPSQISSIIQSDTLEGVTLLLCYSVLDLQKVFNANKSEDEQVNFITAEIDDSLDKPYVTIKLTDVKVDFNLGTWAVKEDPFGEGVYGEKYPWNSGSVLQCLCHSLMLIFEFEKQTIYNPDELERMTFSFTQNTNINEAMFLLNATYEIPLVLNVAEGNIVHSVDPYLVGSY
ncbi:MAG: hypothetical protein F6K40_12265 [Okeania sp. SIO3I5]|uniref:hypothetical protein n=1 Tax=Okeania sp. SIO3I5 TaxID=2607805 RepID=UPI0013BD8DE2|nr:hypothetical protein [Okeania sp. SIO3I5]NEQ37004.1 hypothetical protein [Okeania sp. SIO3I5]